MGELGERGALQRQPLVRLLQCRCDMPTGDAELPLDAVGHRHLQQPRQGHNIGLQRQEALNRKGRRVSAFSGVTLQAPHDLHTPCVVRNAEDKVKAGLRAFRREG